MGKKSDISNTEVKRLAPTANTLKILFAKSGNQCSFPNCEHSLIDEDDEFIAQVCHIEDALPGGRFNEDMTEDERRQPDNLILLCYKHHKKTNDINKYSVSKLNKIKKKHESKFTEKFMPSEEVIQTIFKELSEDIKQIKIIVQKNQVIGQNTLDNTLAILDKMKNQDNKVSSVYSEQITNIISLRKEAKHKTAISLLKNIKRESWSKLNDFEKYRLIANIGICYLETNNSKKASKYLIKALGYNKDDEKALGFAALGYVLAKKYSTANEIINSQLAKGTKNSNIYIALVLARKSVLQPKEVEDLIPKKIKETSEVLFALSGIYLRDNNYELAIDYLQRAVDNSKKGKENFQATLASTILESVANPFDLISKQISSDKKNKINYCIELYTEVWNIYKNTELKKEKVLVLLNRGIAKSFLFDKEGATKDIAEAFNLCPNDKEIIWRYAFQSFINDDFEKSLKLLDKLIAKTKTGIYKTISLYLFKAQVLLKLNEESKAQLLLENISYDGLDYKNINEINSTLIHILLRAKKHTKAENIGLEMFRKNPDSIRACLDLVEIFDFQDKELESNLYLNEAYDRINSRSNNGDIHELALIYYRNENFNKAIELLEKIVNSSVLSDISELLIEAYIKIKEFGKALSLCDKIEKNINPNIFIVERKANIYNHINDYENEEKTYKDFLKIYPEHNIVLVRLAILYAEQNKKELIMEILDKDIYLNDLPFVTHFYVAKLNFIIGNNKEGLEIAFNTRRSNFNEPIAHQFYIGLITEFERNTKRQLYRDYVEQDTGVTLQYSNGNIEKYLIVKTKLLPNEIIEDSNLGEKLIGRKLSEKVIIEKNFGINQEIHITEILDKYTFAFRDSLSLIGKGSLDVEGFTMLDSTNFIENINSLVKIDNKWLDQLKKVYQDYRLNVGFFATQRKQNPILSWSFILSNKELGFHSEFVSQKENNLSIRLLHQKMDIVLEFTSLLTLSSIGKLEVLEKLENKIIIPSSALEIINNFLSEHNMSKEGHLTLGEQDGKLVRQTVTKEEIETSIKYYKKLLKWINDNCIIAPSNLALQENYSVKEQFNKTIGKVTIDAIHLSIEHNAILLSDEYSVRSIALMDFSVNSLSSYALLNFYYNRNSSKENVVIFFDSLIKLLERNFKNLPINSHFLFYCFVKSELKYSHPFDIAFTTLRQNISSEDSAIIVAADFISKMYQFNYSIIDIESVMGEMIQVLTKDRNSKQVLGKLIFILKSYKNIPNNELLKLDNMYRKNLGII